METVVGEQDRSCSPAAFSIQIENSHCGINLLFNSRDHFDIFDALAILVFLMRFFPFLAFFNLQPVI